MIGTWSTGGTFFSKLATRAACSATQATTTLQTVRPNPAANSNIAGTSGAGVKGW